MVTAGVSLIASEMWLRIRKLIGLLETDWSEAWIILSPKEGGTDRRAEGFIAFKASMEVGSQPISTSFDKKHHKGQRIWFIRNFLISS